MKCLSRVFQPVITIPKDAKIKSTEVTCKSQKLLLECGLVRPTSAGLFVLLPLAWRALHKLEALVRHSMEARGAQQVCLPTLSDSRLWARSGRLGSSPAELMALNDRHGKKFLLAPTHEEGIADLLADVGPLSYKQLPIILYQISNKYRDELRPKHGLLRAREFLMMDAYGVHSSEECATKTYDHITAAYKDIFDQLELPVHRVRAPAGDMGGTLSHEWQMPAAAGEDQLSVCAGCRQPTRDSGGDPCPNCGGETTTHNSIEVGHTFILGTKYSEPLGASFIPASSGGPQPVIMSCYGIGLTRLVAACLELRSSETALRWPHLIAPYHTLIIGPKEGSAEWSEDTAVRMRELYDVVTATRRGRDAILDDRNHLTIGKRLLMADRMGYPHVVVMGRAAKIGASPPRYELHRPGLEPTLLTLNDLKDLTDGETSREFNTN